MTWEPTHVQFTVLRAKSLVGKLKGKSSAKVTDVFVSIALGKEKFQTSTVKYGGKVPKSVEWFEECDLSIPSMKNEIEISVMNRGLLSDEFIGYVAVPLRKYDVYERPASHWLPLKHKPSKLPDGRYRGEVEVRLTFHVKSRDNETSPGSFKEARSGSIKSLVTAVGDRFKFHRRSLRGEGSQTFSTPQPRKPNKGEGEFVRSYSLTSDKRKSRDFKSRSLMNLQSDYSLTLPNPRRTRQRPSLDDSSFPHHSTSSRSSRGSVTSQEGYLENMFRKEKEVEERISDTFHEEVDEEYDESGDEGVRRHRKSAEFDVFGSSSHSESSDSSESETESPSEEESPIILPKVKLKSESLSREHVDEQPISEQLMGEQSVDIENTNGSELNEDERKSVDIDQVDSSAFIQDKRRSLDLESDMPEGSVYHSAGSTLDVNQTGSSGVPPSIGRPNGHMKELDRVVARELSRKKSISLNSQGSSDNITSSHASSSSLSFRGKSSAQRAFERESPESEIDIARRKISLEEKFNFTGMSQLSNDDSKAVQRRKVKQYTKGGRRYTVQGFENHRSAPDVREHRPSFMTREDVVPEDLINVYRNMNKEELIRLVVTHKAQLIRKDQYIKDLEKYIDQLLVRVMEASPRLLQNL